MSLLPYFNDIDRLMGREFFRPAFIPTPILTPGDFFESALQQPLIKRRYEITRPLEQLSKQLNQLAVNDLSISADDEKFQVSIDVQHFSPEEINVKVVDGQVIVEGNHEEKQDDHGYVSRRFVRRYSLPKECLPDTVQSKLSSDGVLTVSAPKVIPLPSTGERIIPITQTGPVKKQLSSEPQLNKIDDVAAENQQTN